MHEIGEVGNYIYLSMAYTLGNKCAKNLCKRIVLLQLIIENVVTCFFLEHSVHALIMHSHSAVILNQRRWQSLGGQHGKGVDGLFEKVSFQMAFENVNTG